MALSILAGAMAAVAMPGCTRQAMDQEPRYDTFSAASRFPSNSAAQPLLSDTRPRGWIRTGVPRTNPLPMDASLLERGKDMYGVYCSPCHGLVGYGDGTVVDRGFPDPPSYHSPRLRSVSDGYLFDVISLGYGNMYPYAARVQVRDRWAIVAYIRALQLSQWAEASALPVTLRAKLASQQGARDPALPASAGKRGPERPPLPADAVSKALSGGSGGAGKGSQPDSGSAP